MNKAQYTSTSVADGGNGMYPLSTQTLSFIQSQIELLQALAQIGGKRYILKEPANGSIGIVVIDGEVLPLAATPTTGKGIKVTEERQNIVADGTTYVEARIVRSAKYVATYTPDTPDLYAASEFNSFATNQALFSTLQNLKLVADNLNARLYVATGVYSRAQLDVQLTNMRLHCKAGSAVINGAAEYTINVYRNGNTCTQEQILPNMQRYKREYDFDKKAWGEFTAVTENLHIEVKIKNRTTVYVRHGVIPEGVQLVLLRKKRRSKNRRTGGSKTTNELYKGKRMSRQPKNQYVHFKGIVLSTGNPNEWYVPKCIAVADEARDGNLIGKEMPTLCQSLIHYDKTSKVGQTVYAVQHTRKKCSLRGEADDTQAEVYAKIGLQFAVSDTLRKSSGGEMVKMKYRLWWFCDKNPIPFGTAKALRGFSVE